MSQDRQKQTAPFYAPGTMLGPYRIDAKIGAGGMGEVFRGTDTRLGRPVAIKISQQRFDERFEREARAISALNHPNICTLYDIGSQDGVSYAVMEYVEPCALPSRSPGRSKPHMPGAGTKSAQAKAPAGADESACGTVWQALPPALLICNRKAAREMIAKNPTRPSTTPYRSKTDTSHRTEAIAHKPH
jgi:hypothetical protein